MSTEQSTELADLQQQLAAANLRIAELTEKSQIPQSCGHMANFLIGDEWGHFMCTVCRTEEAERKLVIEQHLRSDLAKELLRSLKILKEVVALTTIGQLSHDLEDRVRSVLFRWPIRPGAAELEQQVIAQNRQLQDALAEEREDLVNRLMSRFSGEYYMGIQQHMFRLGMEDIADTILSAGYRKQGGKA